MKMLETTSPCYIRCVKPNHAKRPDMYVAPLCIEQLRNAGVFEAVAIRKGGFPFRKTHEEFAEHYSCVARKTKQFTSQDVQEVVAIHGKENDIWSSRYSDR